MIEYYLPGVDASGLSDHALAMKLAHLDRIRSAEASANDNALKTLLG